MPLSPHRPPPAAPESIVMKDLAAKAIHYAVLIAITAGATAVMWWVSAKNTGRSLLTDSDLAAPPLVAKPRAPVAVTTLRPEVCELAIRYAGKVRPWESFSLGFEIGGRVDSLGVNDAGQPLDDGEPVRAGQVLARLDDRILRARRAEAVAQLEQATSDLGRDSRLYQRGGQAITDAEYQQTLTNVALRKAQLEVATKNLEDSILVSPVDGSISRRMVEAGESVIAHATVFDVVQTDDVLLVVNVPESRVRELQARQRQVARAKAELARGGVGSPEDRVFRARVFLEGRDAFGDAPPPIDAEVFRIAQVADERTGLFEIEVRIPNGEKLLRPGMVATAELVYDRVLAYRVPATAVIFRGRQAHLFAVEPQRADMRVMFWPVGETTLSRARRIELERWVDQGTHVIVPARGFQVGPVVVRGQRRLSNEDLVRIVNPEALDSQAIVQAAAATATARKASPVAGGRRSSPN
ncbi:MAG: efflux RND transporter periplasmic adaptor subunit [Planctomycetota bacterium]